MRLSAPVVVLALAAAALFAAPAQAQTSVTRSFPFELGRWYELDVKEGPITLHRIRLDRQAPGSLKSHVRGANEYDTDVKVELEYSNQASSDWEVAFRVTWMDDSGEPIDGYTGSHGLDEKKAFERTGGSVTTLKYGLVRAKKLKVVLDIQPD